MGGYKRFYGQKRGMVLCCFRELDLEILQVCSEWMLMSKGVGQPQKHKKWFKMKKILLKLPHLWPNDK